MADDPIRAMLASVDPSSMIPTPPGHVAILWSRVEDAGGDPEAVREWVEQRGGYTDRTPPIPSRGLRPGRRAAKEVPGEDFYAVPRDALRP